MNPKKNKADRRPRPSYTRLEDGRLQREDGFILSIVPKKVVDFRKEFASLPDPASYIRTYNV